MNDTILNFIYHFSAFGPQVENCFLYGNCYWFAHILETRFSHSSIVYDEVENHFGCKIDDKVYDISGDVTNQYQWVDWQQYNFTEPSNAMRVRRDCIYFGTQESGCNPQYFRESLV